MDFLLYFLGPILAVGLPLCLFIASAVLGAKGDGNFGKLFVRPLQLFAYSALAVPAQSEAMNGWPAPWWMAAYLGKFTYSWKLMLLIAAVALVIYFVATGLRSSDGPCSEAGKYAPKSRGSPPRR